MTPRARDGLQGARNSEEDMEGTQGPGTRELQAQLRAQEPSNQNSLLQSQHPRGHSRFSSSSLGTRRVGEAFPWREERLLCLWIIPFHVWIHEIRPRGSSGSALTAKGTKPTPHGGIPTAFPEFLQFCKTTSEHQNYRKKDFFPLFSSVQGI